MINKKTAVSTDKAPGAIGPYSQAIRCGNMLFISGQVPLDPASGAVVSDSVVEQTERVMKNLHGILESQGLDFNAVVKTTVFIKDMNDFGKINEVYAKYFVAPFPARATVEVARLPKDVKVEVEAIAFFTKD